ncbi:MAG: copper-binding protein [Pseudomonadota bacterium]
MRFIPILAAAVLASAPVAHAQSSHGSGHGHADHSTMKHGDYAEMAGVHAEATIHSIEGDTVNLSHGPIAEIGWPAMTMDLKLLEGAEVGAVAAGDTAMMMLEKGPDGLYGIRALMPAE